MQEKNEIGNLQAIKQYFGLTLQEMKAEVLPLSEAERAELGDLSREALQGAATGEAHAA